MSAEVQERRYKSGRPYFVAWCVPCGIVLNSGHHYSAANVHHAHALIAEHNAEHHAQVTK